MKTQFSVRARLSRAAAAVAAAAPMDEIDEKVLRRYDVGAKLGKGAYGVVWRATDSKTGDVVALKKIFDAFQNPTDSQRTFREIVFLRQMEHENIVALHRTMRADNDKDIYLVFEHMETDLHAVIRADILEEVHRQYIVYQTLKALWYMHSAQLVHRDMKPSNLLLNSECLVKVADFGLARSLLDDGGVDEGGPSDNVLTDYVATRWYRAPEILLGSSRYGLPVDMWSLGCILGEMLGGKPIFPGTSTLDQIEKVCETLGRPTDGEVAAMQSPFAATMLDSIVCPPPPGKGWAARFPDASDAARDLLAQLMRFEPDARVGARDALGHPYCADFHRPDAYPVPHRLGRPVGAPLLLFDGRVERVAVHAGAALLVVVERRGGGRNTKV